METRPVLSRTMDVLYKTDPTPRNLRGQCVDVVAGMTLKSLWVEFAAQLENSGGKTAAFLMRTTEAEMRSWSMFLTLDLRLQILESTSKLVMSNLGGGSSSGPVVGGRQVFTPPNPAAVLLASLLEIFYDPSFRKLTLYHDLHWNKDSRIQVLHLLHQKTSMVKELNLACYRSPQYRFQSMPFSEKFILSGCFGRFPGLRILKMPNIADDDLLDKIGESCPSLEELDVSGSFGVTNQGIEWFCKRTKGGARVQSPKGIFSFKKQIDISKRVGYVATPMAGCCVKRQFDENKIGAKKSVDDDNDENGLAGKSGLKRIDLTGTSIDYKGLECLLRDCKLLVTICVDDEIWSALLSTLTDDGSGCIDCVGAVDNVAAISMISNVDKYLDVIIELFPNLQHVTIDAASSTQNFTTFLPMLTKQTSMTIKDVNFDRICPSIRASGSRIRRLNFSGKTSVLDLTLLDEACPNLESLAVAHSQIVVGSTPGRFPERNGSRRFQHLKQCKLWDLNAATDDWKTLIRWAERLQTLYIWNIVITDADISDILIHNRLQDLEDFRVGSTEIGFVRLSETTAISLVRTCPNLKNLGGLCDWKIRDLLTLLQTLLIQGGWKITLEPQQVSSMM